MIKRRLELLQKWFNLRILVMDKKKWREAQRMNPQTTPTNIITNMVMSMTMITSLNKMMKMRLLPSLGSSES